MTLLVPQHRGKRVPLYEYQCLPERHRFEVRQGINDDPVTVCQQCGAPVRRVVQPVGIVFKGSGFYVNDSRKSSNPTTKPADGNQSADGNKPSDGNKRADSNKSDTAPSQESGSTSSEKAATSTESKKDSKSESKAAS